MIVADVGNTDTVFGFFEKDELIHTKRLPSNAAEGKVFYAYHLENFILENNIPRTLLDFGAFSSVVPEMNEALDSLLSDLTGRNCVQITPNMFSQFPALIDNPQELGSDLYCNAIAAYLKYNKACIIVDFGTALTFTAVNSKGAILGVAIAPGMGTAIKSLFQNTAQLPQINIENPTKAIGTNTVASIQSGVVLGYTGLVAKIIEEFKNEMEEGPAVLATGGLSGQLSSLQSVFDTVDINLTLTGISKACNLAIGNNLYA